MRFVLLVMGATLLAVAVEAGGKDPVFWPLMIIASVYILGFILLKELKRP